MEEPKLLEIVGQFTNVIRAQSQSIPHFVLRGNCVTDTTIVCEDIATLQAAMNPHAATISITVPRTILQEQLGSSLAGARIVPQPTPICEGITSKVAAYFSLCKGAGASTGDHIPQTEDDAYAFAAARVDVGLVPAGAAPAYTTPGTVGGSPTTYSAVLDTSSLPAGDYDVHVRACFGTNCGTSVRTISL